MKTADIEVGSVYLMRLSAGLYDVGKPVVTVLSQRLSVSSTRQMRDGLLHTISWALGTRPNKRGMRPGVPVLIMPSDLAKRYEAEATKADDDETPLTEADVTVITDVVADVRRQWTNPVTTEIVLPEGWSFYEADPARLTPDYLSVVTRRERQRRKLAEVSALRQQERQQGLGRLADALTGVDLEFTEGRIERHGGYALPIDQLSGLLEELARLRRERANV